MIARPFRVGVAGLGFGAAIHVPGLRLVPGVEVVALAGSSRAHAATQAERLRVPIACGGIDELLRQDLDAVTLALPPNLMEDAASRALDRGLAVLCEKPLADSAAAAARLTHQSIGRTAAVGFQFPELTTFRALKQTLDSGRLGALRRVSIVWSVESRAHRERQWSWKLDAGRGGGVLTVLGSHLLHLIDWLVGPCSLHGTTLDNAASALVAPAGARAAEDSAMLVLIGRDGVRVTVMLSNARPGTSRHRWDVIGERGRAALENLSVDYMAGFVLTVDGETVAVEPPADGDGRLPAFCSLATRFVEAARRGQPVMPDFATGARVQSLIEAARARHGDAA